MLAKLLRAPTSEPVRRPSFPSCVPIACLAGAACRIDIGLEDSDAQTTPTVVVEERFTQSAWPALDVLFVMDGTGSMREEQAGIAAAAPTFLAEMDTQGLSWQVGVVSMDLEEGGALRGRPWILTPRTEDAAGLLAATLAVGTDDAPPAAGLDAAALALWDEAGANHGFRRDDAALHLIFVSDGDDGSGEVLGGDAVGALVALLEDEAARTGHPARASALVDDEGGACDEGDYDATPGPRFVAVAEATGGTVASICAPDFEAVAAALGDVAVEGATVFPLQAEPDPASVLVSIDGVRQTSGWAVDSAAPAIVFEVAPPLDAVVTVRYEIAS